VKDAFLINPAVGVRAEIVALRLKKVRGQTRLAIAVNVSEGI